jgi:hypothetical protein
MFFFEPHTWYTAYVDDELINQNFDIFMTPSQVIMFFMFFLLEKNSYLFIYF